MIYKHQSLTLVGRLVRNKDRPYIPGGAISVKSTVTDSGGPRTTLLRPGLVLGKKNADGLYYLADDTANVTAAGSAAVTALITMGAGAQTKTFKWTYKDGPESTVTTGGGDNTDTLVAAALNASKDFAADLVASVVAARVVITSRRAGADEYFKITAGTINNQGGGGGDDTFVSNNTQQGSDADFRVLEDYVDMLGEDGSVADSVATNTKAGTYIAANLLKLTAEAKAHLLRRGAVFE